MIEGLCPHDRLTTAYCKYCWLEAEIYVPNKIIAETISSETISFLSDAEELEWSWLARNVARRDSGGGSSASEKQIGGSHYKDMEIQPHYFCHQNKLGALESNAIKYICRHHQKGGQQDLEKAIHYLNLLIEWEYLKKKDPAPSVKKSSA